MFLLLVWEQLEKENADFFNKYHLIRELARQIKLFNSFLGKQVSLMLENGDFDISTATCTYNTRTKISK